MFHMGSIRPIFLFVTMVSATPLSYALGAFDQLSRVNYFVGFAVALWLQPGYLSSIYVICVPKNLLEAVH